VGEIGGPNKMEYMASGARHEKQEESMEVKEMLDHHRILILVDALN
jgi:hypothetical protein